MGNGAYMVDRGILAFGVPGGKGMAATRVRTSKSRLIDPTEKTWIPRLPFLFLFLLLFLFFLDLQFRFQFKQGLLVFEEHRNQDRLKRPWIRGINPGMYMEPGLLKESVKKLLILFPQRPSKLFPLLNFLFQYLTERQNRSSHSSFSASLR